MSREIEMDYYVYFVFLSEISPVPKQKVRGHNYATAYIYIYVNIIFYLEIVMSLDSLMSRHVVNILPQ